MLKKSSFVSAEMENVLPKELVEIIMDYKFEMEYFLVRYLDKADRLNSILIKATRIKDFFKKVGFQDANIKQQVELMITMASGLLGVLFKEPILDNVNTLFLKCSEKILVKMKHSDILEIRQCVEPVDLHPGLYMHFHKIGTS